MKIEQFKGEVASAYGKTLAKPVQFAGSYEAFENYAELELARAVPTNDDVVAFVNAQKKATARAKATVEALDAAGIEKPKNDDPQVIMTNMVKQLMLAKKTKEVAIELAEAALGYKFQE